MGACPTGTTPTGLGNFGRNCAAAPPTSTSTTTSPIKTCTQSGDVYMVVGTSAACACGINCFSCSFNTHLNTALLCLSCKNKQYNLNVCRSISDCDAHVSHRASVWMPVPMVPSRPAPAISAARARQTFRRPPRQRRCQPRPSLRTIAAAATVRSSCWRVERRARARATAATARTMLGCIRQLPVWCATISCLTTTACVCPRVRLGRSPLAAPRPAAHASRSPHYPPSFPCPPHKRSWSSAR